MLNLNTITATTSNSYNKLNLVFISGWGYLPSALQPLATELTSSLPAQVQLYSWLDFVHSPPPLPANSWLIGWSLGGMLAANLAAQQPHKFAGLIMLGSNACFVQQASWPNALPTAELALFMQAVHQEPAQTLQRFAQLCAQGSTEKRQLGLTLRQQLATPNKDQLLLGLKLLQELDLRSAIYSCTAPKLAVFFQQDALVPAGVVKSLQQLNLIHTTTNNACTAQQLTTLLPGSHALPLHQPKDLAIHLHKFITTATSTH